MANRHSRKPRANCTGLAEGAKPSHRIEEDILHKVVDLVRASEKSSADLRDIRSKAPKDRVDIADIDRRIRLTRLRWRRTDEPKRAAG